MYSRSIILEKQFRKALRDWCHSASQGEESIEFKRLQHNVVNLERKISAVQRRYAGRS